MKTQPFLFCLLFSFTTSICTAQLIKTFSKADSIPLGVKFGSYNEELSELYQMINIESYQFHLPLKTTANKKITFSYVEYKDGSFSEHKTLFRNGLDMKKVPASDSIYTFKIAAIKKDKGTVDLWFRYPHFGLSRLALNVDSSVAARYSLRDFVTTIGQQYINIPEGKKVSFLTYSLPYEKDGMLYYCSIMSEGEPEKWAERYGIPHYLIFYMQID